MNSENKTKINLLLCNWPTGTVATLPWLKTLGISQQLAHEYEKSGWLQKLGRGAYTKLTDPVDWSGGVYAFQQQLHLPIHVGGKSALELKGLSHYIPFGRSGQLCLLGPQQIKPPSWFLKYDWGCTVSYHTSSLFGEIANQGFTLQSFGAFDIQISTPERAILELLNLIPTEQSMEEARLIMEGLATLRPQLVQHLLEVCQSYKVKRLFLALADSIQHAWFAKLDPTKLDLGHGNRMIVPGGTFYAKYKIVA